MILAAGDGDVQRHRTHCVQSRSHEQVQINLLPRPARVPRQYAQHHQEDQIFYQIEQVVMRAVERNVEHDILIRENNERIKKDPPHQQHQKVERAEVKLLFFQQMGTQSHRCYEGNNVNKENHVSTRGREAAAAENDFVERP